MKDALIILSGGMDSTTLMHEYKDSIAMAVTFRYGSLHNEREIECAKWQCKQLNIPHIVIDLEFIHQYFKSSLLSSPEEIPEGNYEDDNMKSTVVPFRNGIMLSIACGLAESEDLNRVMIANHGGDHEIYPDCRPEFISAMDQAMQRGTYANVALVAPYSLLSKGDIAVIGRDLGVDYTHTYSCYKGGENPCGKCATCRERNEALKFAGLIGS